MLGDTHRRRGTEETHNLIKHWNMSSWCPKHTDTWKTWDTANDPRKPYEESIKEQNIEKGNKELNYI